MCVSTYTFMQMATQVHSALKNYGFMLLKNNGMDDKIAALRKASVAFFHAPEDDAGKQKARANTGMASIRGYYTNRELNTYEALGRKGPPDYCASFFMVGARVYRR